MKHLFFYSLFAMLALLASCSEYDLGYTSEQIGYNAAFHKEFGDFDKKHDFNLAQRAFLSVTPSENGNVRIYGKQGNSWTLVGNYNDVAATRELGFDVSSDVTELLVSDGRVFVETTNGGSVTLANPTTRAGEGSGNVSELNDGLKYSYLYYDKTSATSFEGYIPENKDNRNKVTQNFNMRSTGEFIVYPTYWNCNDSTTVFLYYYDSFGEIQYEKLFSNYAGNECVQFLTENGDWETYYGLQRNGHGNAPFEYASNYRSKGIIVNLPVGTLFGFAYCADARIMEYGGLQNHYFSYKPGHLCPGASDGGGENRNATPTDVSPLFPDVASWYIKGQYIHSDAQINPYWYAPDPINDDINFRTTAFATFFDAAGDLIVGVEDHFHFGIWTGGWRFCHGTDWDYNDLIFKIYGATPEIINNDSPSWVLPFEDLGGNHDWDFNDVILKFKYASGEPTAQITPIAAGGTLHSEVFFNDTDDESKAQDLGEIHVLLGADPLDDDELYEPINASHRGTPGTVKNVNITNPSLFTLAANKARESSSDQESSLSSKATVGVYIQTQGEDKYSVIAYNGTGKVPAMLVLPETYVNYGSRYEWAWPVENKDIREAYNVSGHSFSEWVADHTKAQDWYMYPSSGTVEEKKSSIITGTTTSSPEYSMRDFGTIISLPSKNSEGVYTFPATHFSDLSSAIVTIVIKSVQNNALYAYDGSRLSEKLGEWSRMNLNGTITVMGNNSCGDGVGQTRFEGIYQVRLNPSELALIKQIGTWIISAGDESKILAMAVKTDESSAESSQGQEEEPGSSNDPANGSEPVLAPIR